MSTRSATGRNTPHGVSRKAASTSNSNSTDMNAESIRQTLVSAVTRYDMARARKPGYNCYALGHYLARVDDIIADIDAGADTRAAVVAGFTGPVLSTCLRALKLAKPTNAEWAGEGSVAYAPASNH